MAPQVVTRERDGVCIAGCRGLPSPSDAREVSQSLSSRQGHPVLIGSKSWQRSRHDSSGPAAPPHTAWRAGHTELVEALAKIAKQEVHHPGNESRVSIPPRWPLRLAPRGPLWRHSMSFPLPLAFGPERDFSSASPIISSSTRRDLTASLASRWACPSGNSVPRKCLNEADVSL